MAGMGANRSPACHKRFGISEAKIKPTKPNKRGPLVRIRPESGRVRRGGQGFSGRRLATCARAAPITAARRALRSQAKNGGPRSSAGGRGGPRHALPRSTHWVPHDSQRAARAGDAVEGVDPAMTGPEPRRVQNALARSSTDGGAGMDKSRRVTSGAVWRRISQPSSRPLTPPTRAGKSGGWSAARHNLRACLGLAPNRRDFHRELPAATPTSPSRCSAPRRRASA